METTMKRLGRRRARGVAMVEAVVTIPALILLFAALIFGWRLYGQQGQVILNARLRVWTYADANCEGDALGGMSTSGLDNGSGQWVDENDNPVDLSGANKATAGASNATTHKDTLTRTLGTVSLTTHGSVQASSLLGGFTSSVSGKRTVMCNEKPYNASLIDMAPAAFQAVSSW
jgi:hypothetical protein